MTTILKKRATLVKVVFAGIALISAQITLTQLDLVRRVISEQLVVQLPSVMNDELVKISRPDTQQPPPSTANTENARPKAYAEVQRPTIIGQSYTTVNNATAAPHTRKRGKFQTDPGFSDKLIGEFIKGAAEDALYQKQRRQIQRDRQKRRRKVKKKREKVPLKVPYPIFVPSLPKSGTTTTHQYFQCGGQKSAHLAGRNDDSIFKLGRCAQQNVREGRAPFSGCGDYEVWTDTGYVAARYRPDSQELQKNNIQCFYPLIDALEEVYTAYPNATFLFAIRETDAWLNSIQTYQDGFIMEVWKRCRTQGFPGRDGTLEDFREFYEWHKEMIRNFALEHPSLTYIEVDLESPETGDILEERIGIDASCWGHHNQQKSKEASKTESSNENDVGEENENSDAAEESS